MNEKLNEYTFDEIKIGLKETFEVEVTESLGFKPKYSSLDTILDELPYFLSD